MSYYPNNHGTYGDHQYYTGMPQQQNMNIPVTGGSSTGGMYVTDESRRESYMGSYASWSNYPPPDTTPTGYRGGPWQDDHYLDQPCFSGSSFSAPANGAMNLATGMEGDPRTFPVTQFQQPYSPTSVGQTPGSHWQSPWAHAEHTARRHRHDDGRGSMSAPGTRTEVPPYQPASRSVNAHRGAVQTGQPHPVSIPVGRRDPVPAPITTSPTRSRGERWTDAPTFPCQWVTHGKRCGGFIAGDRRSVTSHLRDRHGEFSSDGKTIACDWAGCSTRMQRRNITRHILAFHLEVKVPCLGCGMLMSRADANRKHQQACSKALGAEEDDGVY